MKVNLRLLVCAFAFLGLSKASGYDDQIAWPALMLQRITLKEDVSLSNSPDVYAKLTALTDKRDGLNDPAPDLKTIPSIVWTKNSRADTENLTIALHRGVTLYDAIVQVAKMRSEVVQDCRNHLVIRKSGERRLLLKTYRDPNDDRRSLAADWINARLLGGKVEFSMLHIHELEDVVRIKMKESLSLEKSSRTEEIVLRVDSSVKDEDISKVSFAGEWIYSELLDAYCAELDLRWAVHGNEIIVRAAR